MKQNFTGIFKKGSKTYFTSTLFFPKKQQETIARLYAFVRIADDYVDSIPQQSKEYHAFKSEYYTSLHSKSSSKNEVIDSFIDLQHEYSFEQKWVDGFFESMEMDLNNHIYKTFEDTEKYIYGSAEVIGLFMNRLLEVTPKADISAQYLGKAFQYINFIRDVAEDQTLGRTYFPITELEKRSLPDLSKETALKNEENFIKFMRDQIARYIGWNDTAAEGFHYLPKRYRIPIQTAASMYEWTAQQIWENPFIVYEKKVKPSFARIIFTGLSHTLLP
jgi:phytoene synthase